jgi:hypothetical protein
MNRASALLAMLPLAFAASTGQASSADSAHARADRASEAASLILPSGAEFIDIAGVPYSTTGDTTGGVDTVNFVPNFCAARGDVDGPERIYRFVAQEGANVTFTVTPQNDQFDVAIYLIDSLKGGEYCLIGADDNGPGGAETFSFSDRFRPGITYYLYVDSFYDADANPAAAQGPYRLELTGSLPVELQGFVVD